MCVTWIVLLSVVNDALQLLIAQNIGYKVYILDKYLLNVFQRCCFCINLKYDIQFSYLGTFNSYKYIYGMLFILKEKCIIHNV